MTATNILLVKPKNTLPYNPKLKKRARDLRHNLTKPERKLWYEFLSQHSLSFLRQRSIDNYIADFYCARKKLIIELDGDSHFINETTILYDQQRTKTLEKYGLKILRFNNNDVMQNFEGVCWEIDNTLKKLPLSRGDVAQRQRGSRGKA